MTPVRRAEPKQKILFVEDDAATAELVSLALSGEFDFETAPSAAVALERFEQQQPHLIIFDLRLGGGADGMAVFQEMARRLGHTPVAIVVSGADEAESVARALGVPVLRKPFTRRALRDMVHTVLAHRPRTPAWRDFVRPGERVAAQVDGQRRTGEVLSNAGGIVRFRDDTGQIFIVARERIEIARAT